MKKQWANINVNEGLVDFFETPDVVARLGESIFIKTPLFQLKNPYAPLYIHEALYYKIFKNSKNVSCHTMFQRLSSTFSITINKDNLSDKQIGWAYIDRQTDPLNLSEGNQGSGRAYYTGKFFNIKGEKTPLATSKNPEYIPFSFQYA